MNGAVRESIFRALAKNPYGLTADGLVAEVYRGAKEPDNARDVIYVVIHNIRKLKLPFTIRTVYKCGLRYQLFFR